jgi:hypothetical protein
VTDGVPVLHAVNEVNCASPMQADVEIPAGLVVLGESVSKTHCTSTMAPLDGSTDPRNHPWEFDWKMHSFIVTVTTWLKLTPRSVGYLPDLQVLPIIVMQ